MKNSLTFKVIDVKKVIQKMTFKNLVTLNNINILHVVDMRKNLVFDALLSKNGFKLVFESDKFILSKNKMFIEEGYFNDGLFKRNILTIITMNERNKYNNVYLISHFDVVKIRFIV